MKDMALHVLDLVQNSISAGANLIEISTMECFDANRYVLEIKDNGKGMPEELLQRVVDPYATTRTTRKVGMGIPLLKHNVDSTGGYLKIHSKLGEGTILRAEFVLNHIDRIPMGEMADVLVLSAAMNPTLDFTYTHSNPNGIYVFDTREIKAELEEVSIAEPEIQRALKEMISFGLSDILAMQ